MQNIVKIYVGKDKVCRCGCAGKYYYPEHTEFSALLEKFQKSWKRYEKAGKVNDIDLDSEYQNISFAGNKAMTAYFGE